MDEDQLAELEMHLAAGTGISTALAAVQRDATPQVKQSRWFYMGLALGFAIALLWLLW